MTEPETHSPVPPVAESGNTESGITESCNPESDNSECQPSFLKRSPFPVLCIALIIFLLYGAFEARWIEINEITFAHPDVPPAFNGKRIAFVSDIHYGPTMSAQRLRRIVRRIDELKPDIILHGGDYIYQQEQGIPIVFDALSTLSPPLGSFGVLGNHDAWINKSLTLQEMQRAGITPLNNRSVRVTSGNDSIVLGGVNTPWAGVHLTPRIMQDVRREDFMIMLSHNPEFAQRISNSGIDLMLSGHTHGGQITFFGLYAPVLPPRIPQNYRSGLVTTAGGMPLIVTKGIGTIFPPIRFFARPEVVIITLQRSPSPA